MYVVFFDATALLLSLITLAAYRKKTLRALSGGRIFPVLIIVVLCSSLFSLLSSIATNQLPRSGRMPVLILTSLYYLANFSILPLVVYYLFNESQSAKRTGIFQLVWGLPYSAGLLLIAVNPATRLLFYIDPRGIYRHGPAFAALYAIVGGYLLLTALLLFRGGPFLTRARKVAGMMFLLFCVTGIAVQRLVPGIMLEAFCASLGVLFMFVTLQHPKSATDSQTGAVTRTMFEQAFSRLIVAKTPFSVVVVYSPDFRELLELLEVIVYRKLAQSFYEWIAAKVPPAAVIARLDEGAYAVMLKGSRDSTAAQYLALDMLERAYAVWDLDPVQVELSVQVGVLSFPEHFLTFSDAMDRISGILKVSDLIGDRHVFYASDIVPGAWTIKAGIAAALKNVLATGTLELGIQGIFDVTKSETRTAEITSMLTLPSGERIPHRELFDIAGEVGLSAKTGTMLLENACHWFVATNGMGNRLHTIQVSLSAAQCVSVGWHRDVWAVISGTGIRPDALYLGIGETAITTAGEQLKEGMQFLIEAGVRLFIDDYGTGFTDLGLLPHLPFNLIKFDEIILSDGIANKRTRTILAGTISYLTRLGFSIASRGIDTPEQAELMTWVGCQFLQGGQFGGIEPVRSECERAGTFSAHIIQGESESSMSGCGNRWK